MCFTGGANAKLSVLHNSKGCVHRPANGGELKVRRLQGRFLEKGINLWLGCSDPSIINYVHTQAPRAHLDSLAVGNSVVGMFVAFRQNFIYCSAHGVKSRSQTIHLSSPFSCFPHSSTSEHLGTELLIPIKGS